MFERFTSEARTVIEGSTAAARRLGHGWLGTEHLALALLAVESPAARVLRGAGVSAARVEDGIRRALGPPLADDETALRSIGIDLDAVRSQIDAQFGPGALDRAGGRSPRGRVGAPCFTPRLKKVCELSLREAIARKDRHIGPEHLLLGLIREGEGLAAEVLVGLGVDLDGLRVALLAELRQAS